MTELGVRARRQPGPVDPQRLRDPAEREERDRRDEPGPVLLPPARHQQLRRVELDAVRRSIGRASSMTQTTVGSADPRLPPAAVRRAEHVARLDAAVDEHLVDQPAGRAVQQDDDGRTAGRRHITVEQHPGRREGLGDGPSGLQPQEDDGAEQHFGNPPILYKPFQSTATMAGGSSYSSSSLLGRGKKVTVIYGRMTHKMGGGADGRRLAAADAGLEHRDGSVRRRRQLRLLRRPGMHAGGRAGRRCTGASTSNWTFGNGNVSTQARDPRRRARRGGEPDVPDGQVQRHGVQREPTFALTGLPSYTFTVAKNTAYNRDWKFGP